MADTAFELQLMKDMTDHQRSLFLTQMESRRKNATTGVLLAVFLGGVGGHRFYMGQTGLGLLYLAFCWLAYIPGMIALVEAFLMSGRVSAYNQKVALEIASQVKQL